MSFFLKALVQYMTTNAVDNKFRLQTIPNI